MTLGERVNLIYALTEVMKSDLISNEVKQKTELKLSFLIEGIQ